MNEDTKNQTDTNSTKQHGTTPDPKNVPVSTGVKAGLDLKSKEGQERAQRRRSRSSSGSGY